MNYLVQKGILEYVVDRTLAERVLREKRCATTALHIGRRWRTMCYDVRRESGKRIARRNAEFLQQLLLEAQMTS
jgi:hypothetical protein